MPGRLPQMPPEIASAPLSVQNKWRLQQTKPVGSMAGTAIPPEHANLHGDAYLATLSPGLATVIKKIAAYDLPVNQVTSMRTGEREAMTERVTQFDPSFDMKEYPVRQKAVTEFRTGGPGSPAGNRVAIGQAINHMGTLDKLNQAMENNDIPMANRIKNLWAQETGKTPPVSAQVARVAVGEELMRVFRQVQGSEAEVNRWIDGFPKQGSPAQQHEALVAGAKLLKGRLDELNNRWNDAMKVTTGYPNIISPQAQASLDQFLGGSAPAKTQGGWSVVR